MDIGDYLDALTVMQDVVKWYDLPIHLRNHEFIAELAVYRVREVYWSRTLRKCDDISLRGEYEYLICEYAHMHLLHEFASLHTVFDDIFDRLYPVAVCGLYRLSLLTIVEVCCDSDLCLQMHIWRTDLYLCRLRSYLREESYHGRMK